MKYLIMFVNVGRFIGNMGRVGVGVALCCSNVPHSVATNNQLNARSSTDVISISRTARNMHTHSTSPKISAPEMYISYLLSKQVPYSIKILGNEFVIKDHNTYPPGNLTRMFGEFIVESKITAGKVVADGFVRKGMKLVIFNNQFLAYYVLRT